MQNRCEFLSDPHEPHWNPAMDARLRTPTLDKPSYKNSVCFFHQIEEIFTSVYQYSCVVDSTTTQTSDTGEAVEGKTVVYMHFIDDTHNEPVPKDAIIQ